jgi:hypothetical protein
MNELAEKGAEVLYNHVTVIPLDEQLTHIIARRADNLLRVPSNT